jgi:hypothetical protein
MTYKPRIKYEAIKSVAFGGIGAAYALVGTTLHPIRWYKMDNLTDAGVLISFDGVTDHIVLPRYSFLIKDCDSNKIKEDGWELAQGTGIYVKRLAAGTAPTVFGFYISCAYAG